VPLPAHDITDYRDWLLARSQRVQRGVTVSTVVAAIAALGGRLILAASTVHLAGAWQGLSRPGAVAA
jgi:hypothetical protein